MLDDVQVASEAGQSAMLGKDVEQLQRRNRELVEAVSLAESRVRPLLPAVLRGATLFWVT